MKKGSDLTLRIQYSLGKGELEIDLSHPLAGPFRRAIKTGKPTGRLNFLLVQDGVDESPVVAGVFAHTPGDRLLFFLGSSIEIETDHPWAHFDGARLDHMTLDPLTKVGKYSSHVAVQGLPAHESRGSRHTANPPSGYMVPWFSLLVPHIQGFPKMPKTLSIQFQSPRPDLARFGKQLIGEPRMALVPLPRSANRPSYVQFDVWAGRGSAWQAAQVKVIAWAYKPEIVADAPKGQQNIIVNRMVIRFSSTAGVVVLISRPAGELLVPRILRPTLSH